MAADVVKFIKIIHQMCVKIGGMCENRVLGGQICLKIRLHLCFLMKIMHVKNNQHEPNMVDDIIRFFQSNLN